jgi:predicted transport protein
VRGVGHFGTGDLEITIQSMADIEKAKPLFDLSYKDS